MLVLERKNRALVLEAVLEAAVVDAVAETNPRACLAGTHLGDTGIIAEPKGVGLELGAGLTEVVVDVVEKTISHGSLGTNNCRLGAVVTTTKEAALILEI